MYCCPCRFGQATFSEGGLDIASNSGRRLCDRYYVAPQGLVLLPRDKYNYIPPEKGKEFTPCQELTPLCVKEVIETVDLYLDRDALVVGVVVSTVVICLRDNVTNTKDWTEVVKLTIVVTRA